MDKKKYAKIYILSMLGLYFAGALVLFLLLLFLSNRNDVNNALELNQIICISLLLPLLPCASYAGFCEAFRKVKEFTGKQKVLIAFCFPLVFVCLLVYGAIMLIPSVIKQSLIIIHNS